MSHVIRRLSSLVFVLALLVLTLGPINPTGASASTAYYLSTSGNDANPGTEAAPFRTFTAALPKLRAGDTLLVRGGTYVENAILNGSSTLAKGSSSNRITVQAYPGENPVLQGIVHLSQADYWTIDNIDVTWNPANTDTSQHMFRFFKGTGWELKNSELSGARSYAALLVNGGASNFSIHHNRIRDTHPSNDVSQDHSIYISDGNNGAVEYNLLTNAPNGRGVKLGHPNGGLGTPHSITVRYNTMVGNGSANVGVSYDTSNNKIFGNVMVTAGSGYANVGTYRQTGPNNVISDNVGWDAKGVLKDDPILVDGGGNLYADPQLDGNFMPRNPALFDANGTLRFGHLAGASTTPAPQPTPTTPAPTPTPSPEPTTPEPTTPEPTPSPTTPAPTPTPEPTTPPAPQVILDAQVVSVAMPSAVNPGTAATVTVLVKNNGSASASIPVLLQGAPSGFSQSKSVTLAVGQTGSVTFSWGTTTATATGTHSFTATSSLSGDSNGANNSASTTTNVTAPVATTMSVSNITLARSSWLGLKSEVTLRSGSTPVAGATVTVRFAQPNRSPLTLTATTNAAGVATFSQLAISRGAYSVTVMNVTKSGLTYNAAGNTMTTKSFTM